MTDTIIVETKKFDELSRDAMRYRWLRNKDSFDEVRTSAIASDGEVFCWLPAEEELDEAIDAAMMTLP